MEKMPNELLKEYVNSQKFTSTADIMLLTSIMSNTTYLLWKNFLQGM